jgi:hypothetical protein
MNLKGLRERAIKEIDNDSRFKVVLDEIEAQMNIFATSSDPKECAQMLDDLRLNKMIVETAQILCTVLHQRGIHEDWMYKPTHEHHPCVVWAGSYDGNMDWLHSLLCHMCDEWDYRFPHRQPHRTGDLVWNLFDKISRIGMDVTPFPNCSLHKDIEDVHLAYRRTMVDKWNNDKRVPKWTKRGIPRWCVSKKDKVTNLYYYYYYVKEDVDA